MPPAQEKIELIWWQQNFEEIDAPIRFNIKHVTPFGDKGSFNAKGSDKTATELTHEIYLMLKPNEQVSPEK